MENYIIDMINDILIGVEQLGSSDASILTETPEVFNSAIHNGIKLIHSNAVMPVAYVILGLIFMLEIYNITIRTEGNHGTMGVEIPFKIIFKLIICKIAIDHTPQILGALFEISNTVIGNISATTFINHAPMIPGIGDIDELQKVIKDMSITVKMMTSVQVLIIWYVFQFSRLMIYLVVFGRMIEIYIMTAIAGIPMVTLANSELSNIGKNFLKSYAAVCLQGVLMYVVLSMFGSLMTSLSVDIVKSNGNIMAHLFKSLFYSLILATAIFSTGRLSKSICNAM